MAKQLKDILAGVRSVKTVPGNLGKDPGVDYEPKAGDEQKFAAMHTHQKHEYPHDNEGMFTGKVDYALDKAVNARLGYTQKEAEKAAFSAVKEKVSESKKAEDAQCNHSAKGTVCPMHGVAECMTVKQIKEEELEELSTDLLHRAAHKAAKVAMTDVQGRSGPIFKKRAAQANKFRAKGMEQEKKEKAAKAMKEEIEIDEVLTKSTTAGETISDFVHSKNPKFAGKSPEKRKQMALAAYYSKQNEDLAVPLLGGDTAKSKTGDTSEEIEMVKAELKAIANKTMHMVMQMPEGMHIEPWCQAKIAAAKSMIGDVHDYMMYGDHKEEEDETMDTPMTFPNMSVDVNTGQNV